MSDASLAGFPGYPWAKDGRIDGLVKDLEDARKRAEKAEARVKELTEAIEEHKSYHRTRAWQCVTTSADVRLWSALEDS